MLIVFAVNPIKFRNLDHYSFATLNKLNYKYSFLYSLTAYLLTLYSRQCTLYLLVYTTYNIYTEKLYIVALPCLCNIIQSLCNIIPPSMTLYM